jgi:hypothetical protein
MPTVANCLVLMLPSCLVCLVCCLQDDPVLCEQVILRGGTSMVTVKDKDGLNPLEISNTHNGERERSLSLVVQFCVLQTLICVAFSEACPSFLLFCLHCCREWQSGSQGAAGGRHRQGCGQGSIASASKGMKGWMSVLSGLSEIVRTVVEDSSFYILC